MVHIPVLCQLFDVLVYRCAGIDETTNKITLLKDDIELKNNGQVTELEDQFEIEEIFSDMKILKPLKRVSLIKNWVASVFMI